MFKIIFNEIQIGVVPMVHDHMIDPCKDDGVTCESFDGLTSTTRWLSYEVPDGSVKIECDSDDWSIEIITKNYVTSFTVPRDTVYNITIF